VPSFMGVERAVPNPKRETRSPKEGPGPNAEAAIIEPSAIRIRNSRCRQCMAGKIFPRVGGRNNDTD
jgi:hypothetical protein